MNDFDFDLEDYDEDGYIDDGDDSDVDSDNDFDSLSGLNDLSDGDNDIDNNSEDDRKRLIIIACIGIFVIVLVFIIAGAIGSKRNRKNYSNTNTETVSQQSQISTAFDNSSTISSWTDIVPDKSVTFGDDIGGIFTVTSIKYLAKQSGNETITRAVATGSISGLSGTYEIELPYHLAVDVNIGNSFELYYKLGNIDGRSIVSISRIK